MTKRPSQSHFPNQTNKQSRSNDVFSEKKDIDTEHRRSLPSSVALGSGLASKGELHRVFERLLK